MALKDENGRVRTGVPTMFVAAPIRDESFQVVGVLALRIRPELEFTRILQLGRVGDSGETYAFDKNGLFVSNSRFDDALILLGLLPDQENSHSILQLLDRDPGGDMTKGHRSTTRRHDLPLTRMAADAIAGNAGVDVEGYRDYRGVKVAGAWKWLPDADMGVATEIEYAEAFRPALDSCNGRSGDCSRCWRSARSRSSSSRSWSPGCGAKPKRPRSKPSKSANTSSSKSSARAAWASSTKAATRCSAAPRRSRCSTSTRSTKARSSASSAKCKSPASSIIRTRWPSTTTAARPKACSTTRWSILDGIDLQTLVERYGPQPVPRVIHILPQVCGSLYEAHSLGLVHRDIKPANIMLNRRGGEPDVVKVLDFGLVKALDEEKQAGLTQQNSLTGTPLYMSPEAIQLPNSVDARSDLYAVGAVGYFLLTGQPVFQAENVMDLCQQHISGVPMPPSQRVATPIPAALENALLACLEKSRAKRPQTARDLAILLSRCPEADCLVDRRGRRLVGPPRAWPRAD